MIFEAIPSFRDKWKLLQKHYQSLTNQSLRLALARTRHERRFTRVPRRGPQKTDFGAAWGGLVDFLAPVPESEFGPPWGGSVDFLVIPKDSEGDSWGLARNFKTSNGSLRMLPTSIRGRLWKLGSEGPNPTSPGFLVIPKGSEEGFQVPTLGNP